MPTCSQITDALSLLASATSIADLSGTTAPLTPIPTAVSASEIQLTAGGVAVLTVPMSPEVDGTLFSVIVAGTVDFDPTANTQPELDIYFGESLSSTRVNILDISTMSGATGTTQTFFVILDLLWSSASATLSGTARGIQTNGGGFGVTVITRTSTSGFSSLPFFVVAGNGAHAVGSLSLTQFKAQFV